MAVELEKTSIAPEEIETKMVGEGENRRLKANISPEGLLDIFRFKDKISEEEQKMMRLP